MNSKDKHEPASGEPQLNAEQGGFAFVMNIASLDAESYKLTPRSVLRRASTREIELIKERLASFSPVEQVLGVPTWEKKLGASLGPTERLPLEEWRYFVIEYEGTNSEVEELLTASCLAPVELEIAFTLLWFGSRSNAPAVVWHADRTFHTMEFARVSNTFFRKMTSADIEQLKSIYALYQKGESQTRQMVSQVLGLKGLPYHSQLRFLGYFAILESVLTHAPKPEDRYDSIIRQVKKKLALLDARWSSKIDYSPFGGANPEKVWGTMYQYRSAIAHGGNPDFSGELKLLKGPPEALTLIKEAVKAVIRQALIEPQLLRDLREC